MHCYTSFTFKKKFFCSEHGYTVSLFLNYFIYISASYSEYVSEIVKDISQNYWPVSLCNQRNTVARLLAVCGLALEQDGVKWPLGD